MTGRLLLLVLLLATPASAAGDGFADGVAAVERGDLAGAVAIFRPLAEAGDVAAQYNMGLAYANGSGVERDDAEAVRWLRRAAAADYAMAELMLGIMETYGRGTPVDLPRAAQLFERAALHGNAAAQFSLGMAYQRGAGVGKDAERAVQLFRRAALQGHSKAQVALAAAMADGVGTPVDLAGAHAWLTLAGRGMPEGRPKELTLGLREELAKKMDPAALAESERRSAAFVARPDPDAVPEGHLGDPVPTGPDMKAPDAKAPGTKTGAEETPAPVKPAE